MKSRVLIKGIVEEVKFPNKGKLMPTEVLSAGISIHELEPLSPYEVKNVLPGQVWSAWVSKGGKGGSSKRKAQLEALLEKATFETASLCPHFQECGGCSYQTVPPLKQLELKEKQVQALFEEAGLADLLSKWLPIRMGGSDAKEPLDARQAQALAEGYRNKMELSFGDSFKGGPLTLGLHKRGSFHDIISIPHCRLMAADLRSIAAYTEAFFRERKIPYYSTYRHHGILRHLILRKSFRDNQYLINLDMVSFRKMEEEGVPASQMEACLQQWTEGLLALTLEGEIGGILHTENDQLSDVAHPDRIHALFGKSSLTERLLGLDFEISPFSFFQTNTRGAATLYGMVREMAQDIENKTVFDLYCGTGTIAQIMADAGAKAVYGIEIVEEAVEAARRNAEKNQLTNCHFIAGDVLKEIANLTEKPDLVILDPPRDGVHPKALPKLLAFEPKAFIYISCKPTSLVRDLPVFLEAGYQVEAIRCCEMFPNTVHVETVCLLSRKAD